MSSARSQVLPDFGYEASQMTDITREGYFLPASAGGAVPKRLSTSSANASRRNPSAGLVILTVGKRCANAETVRKCSACFPRLRTKCRPVGVPKEPLEGSSGSHLSHVDALLVAGLQHNHRKHRQRRKTEPVYWDVVLLQIGPHPSFRPLLPAEPLDRVCPEPHGGERR